MKIFLDTEFTGLHQKTTFISLGIISEYGDTFYAEFTDYDKTQITKWIQRNVIDNLILDGKFKAPWYHYTNIDEKICLRVVGDTKYIEVFLKGWMTEILEYRKEKEIEVWSDCLAYDWVLFNQIFGHAFNLPEYIFYIPFDICTLMKIKNIDPDVNREEFIENIVEGDKHNSLYDAEVIKVCYDKLIKM